MSFAKRAACQAEDCVLIMSGDDFTKGVELVAAAAAGSKDDVLKCLEAGANIHHENDLALRAAAMMGNFENVALLVEKGANVRAFYSEALLFAAKRADYEIVEFLIAKGADVEEVIRHHKKDVDQNCRAALEHPISRLLSAEFEKDRRKIAGKIKSRKKPGFKPD